MKTEFAHFKIKIHLFFQKLSLLLFIFTILPVSAFIEHQYPGPMAIAL